MTGIQKALASGADVIVKRFGNKAFTRTVNWLIGTKLTDTQSGFRAYSREAAPRMSLFGRYSTRRRF
jgi:hypothetical protein